MSGASVPLALVRTLRDELGASMKDCKQALLAANLDLAVARRILRGEAVASPPTTPSVQLAAAASPPSAFASSPSTSQLPMPMPMPAPADDPFANIGSAD